MPRSSFGRTLILLVRPDDNPRAIVDEEAAHDAVPIMSSTRVAVHFLGDLFRAAHHVDLRTFLVDGRADHGVGVLADTLTEDAQRRQAPDPLALGQPIIAVHVVDP